jgi:hypothetical protein
MKLITTIIVGMAISTVSPAAEASVRPAAHSVQVNTSRGTLTQPELRVIRSQQAAIRAYRQRALRNGKIGPLERMRLNAMERDLNQMVTRFSRNNVRR